MMIAPNDGEPTETAGRSCSSGGDARYTRMDFMARRAFPARWMNGDGVFFAAVIPPSVERKRSRGTEDSGRFPRMATMCVALLLIVAGTLKVQQLLAAPSWGFEGGIGSRGVLLFACPIEIGLGGLLFLRGATRRLRRASLVLFCCFLAVSLHKALTGIVSCDCFGRLSVTPWRAAGVDILAIGALLWNPVPAVTLETPFVRCPSTLSVSLIIVGGATAVASPLLEHTANRLFLKIAPTHFEPTDSIGMPFALSAHIDVGQRLNSGLWLVLLYRNDCAACKDAQLHYEHLAAELAGRAGVPRVAAIDCARYAVVRCDLGATLVRGRLLPAGHAEWKIPTPISVLIDNGTVRSVFSGDNAHDVNLFRQIWVLNERGNDS